MDEITLDKISKGDYILTQTDSWYIYRDGVADISFEDMIEGYWNNDLGCWTPHIELATLFSDYERQTLDLPVGENIKWEKYEEGITK